MPLILLRERAGSIRPLRIAQWLFATGVVIGCAGIGLQHGTPGTAQMVAIVAASVISSIAGFAFSAICGAMLFHIVESPVQVVQIMMTCSIANQVAQTWAMRRSIDWRDLTMFLAGGVIGLPTGIWLLLSADHHRYAQGLGALLVAYGAYLLVCTPRRLHWHHPLLDFGVGILGGLTGGAAAFPAAPIVVWCGLTGWDKVRQRALIQPYILAMQVVAFVMIGIARQQAGDGIGFDLLNLLYVPIGLFGTMIGLTVFKSLSNEQFAFYVKLLLVGSGLSFLT